MVAAMWPIDCHHLVPLNKLASTAVSLNPQLLCAGSIHGFSISMVSAYSWFRDSGKSP